MLLEMTLSAALLVLSALRALAVIPFRLTSRNPGYFASGNDVARAMPSRPVRFGPENKGFSAVRDEKAGGRLCPTRQFMPALFCVPPQIAGAKIPGFSQQKFWSGPCYGRFGLMRIFVLSAFSANPIAAPNNMGK